MPMIHDAIEVRDLSLSYPGRPPLHALDRVSLAVPTGEFAAIVGPSGCGKSTLLRVLAGLAGPISGAATVEGASTVGRPGAAAYMPQRDLLMPWRRAVDNAAFGAEMAGVPRADARRQAETVLARFGLDTFAQAWPAALSGGMRQRVALLRTVLIPHGPLLLDEPLGALDAITRRDMQSWLQEVWQADEEPRRGALLVTHDVDEAITLADTVYVMSPRPGRIVARVPITLPRPRHALDATTPAFVAAKETILRALEAGMGGVVPANGG